MKLSSLNKKQIETIYQERMKIDFPPSELKPLSMIYDAIERGIYECLGLMDGTDIVGYAYLIRMKGTPKQVTRTPLSRNPFRI